MIQDLTNHKNLVQIYINQFFKNGVRLKYHVQK